MKIINTALLLITILVLHQINHLAYSQVSVALNSGSSSDWVGWDSQQYFPLTISHNGNWPINMNTYNGTRRLTINNGVGNRSGVWQYNATKINIHYGAGFSPIGTSTSPTAMLNLGTDPPTGAIGGQRYWMDVGTFMCINSDNMYVGLKNESSGGVFGTGTSDRMDAVVNWGDNVQSGILGPDNLRFIFTSSQNPTTASGASSNNGLECFRISPVGTEINTTIAYTGIGGDALTNNYYSNLTAYPQNTLEINSPAQSALTFMLDPTENTSDGYLTHNQYWTANNPSTGYSGLRFTDLTSSSYPCLTNGKVLTVDINGDVILVPDAGGFGAYCSSSAFNLTDKWRVGFGDVNNSYNIYFEDGGTTPPIPFTNSIGIGYGCINTLLGKLSVHETAANNGVSCAGFFTNFSNASDMSVGLYGWARGNSMYNVGIAGIANGGVPAGTFWGVYGEATVPYNNPANVNDNNWAGFFNGNVLCADAVQWSDSILKKDVNRIPNSLSIINGLKPVSFLYDSITTEAQGLYCSGKKHYGFIAQNVEKTLPELVTKATKPPQYDTAGNLIHPALTFKALNYDGFIGILTQGIKELDSISDNHETRLDTLEVYGRGDYDWLLSGSNAQARTPGDIDETKYTMGHVGINYNNTAADYVFHVENFSHIPHFNSKPAAKFYTDATGFTMPSYFTNVRSEVTNIPDVSTTIYGVGGIVTSKPSNKQNAGVIGVNNGDSKLNTGVKGFAYEAADNYGVYGEAKTRFFNNYYNRGVGVFGFSHADDNITMGLNIGVMGDARQGTYNYGGYFTSNYTSNPANPLIPGSPFNYGIYASASGGLTNWAAYFDGRTFCTLGVWSGSDLMLKENVVSMASSTHSIDIINQLNPVSYNFKTIDFPQLNLPAENQLGFIAQEVELIIPEIVKEISHPAKYDTLGNLISPAVNFKGIRYEGFIPIIVAAMKETIHKTDSISQSYNNTIDSLKHIINNYENRFTHLEQMINACCLSHTNKSMENPNSGQTTEIELENVQAIVLDQNVTNPFAENTVINYFIPEGINFAQMIFTDNFGRIMKTVDINTSGNGSIKVYASNLSSGIYTYSLIVDGKVIDSKKMVCMKK